MASLYLTPSTIAEAETVNSPSGVPSGIVIVGKDREGGTPRCGKYSGHV